MKEVLDIVRAATVKKKNFTASPETHVPCLECARPIDRNDVTHPRFLLCSCSCKRRFAAKMKAENRDFAKVTQRAFRDVFGIGRGSLEGQRQNLPLLPDPLSMLLYVTKTLHRIEPYKQETTALSSFN